MPASRYLNLIWRCGDGKSQRWDKEGLSIWMEQSCKAKQNNDDYATITVMNCAFRAACKICESATAAHIIIIRPLFDVIMPWFDGCIFQAERTHQFSQPTLKFDPLNIITKTINTTRWCFEKHLPLKQAAKDDRNWYWPPFSQSKVLGARFTCPQFISVPCFLWPSSV